MINQYLDIFATAIVSTVGAFIPLLLVMYVHYRIRKAFYNGLKENLEKEVTRLSGLSGEYDGYMRKHRERFGFKDELDLVTNSEVKSRLGEDNARNIFSYYVGNLKSFRDNFIKEKEKKQTDLNFIVQYSFKRYIVGLLNDKFPEQYFEDKTKAAK